MSLEHHLKCIHITRTVSHIEKQCGSYRRSVRHVHHPSHGLWCQLQQNAPCPEAALAPKAKQNREQIRIQFNVTVICRIHHLTKFQRLLGLSTLCLFPPTRQTPWCSHFPWELTLYWRVAGSTISRGLPFTLIRPFPRLQWATAVAVFYDRNVIISKARKGTDDALLNVIRFTRIN